MRRFVRLPRLAGVVLMTAGAFVVSTPAALAADFYPAGELARDRARYERRLHELYEKGIEPHLGAVERRSLARVRLEFPLLGRNDHPLDFRSGMEGGREFVELPVLSLKMVEDLATAYAWLWANDYSFDTIDLYAAMLHHKTPREFPGGRYPPPLEALGVPGDALADPRVDEMSLRMRNTAYAFILLHELGHVVLRHRGYDGISLAQARSNETAADAFALRVLERTRTIPIGAMLFFQAQAYAGSTATTHPLHSERLRAIARALDGAADREPRPAERDTLRYVAGRLAAISGVLENPVLQDCIAVVADRASAASLAPRRRTAGDQMMRWCRKEDRP